MPRDRDEQLYISDILAAIDRVLTYTAGGRSTFLADPMIQDAVIRNIEIIGEAVRGVSEETRTSHPDIPWTRIAKTRDRVIHSYFRVDLDIVWNIVEKELPGLRQRLAGLLPSP